MPNYQEPNEVTVHRGLQGVAPSEVDPANVGVHWSEEHSVARGFAAFGKPPAYGDENVGTGTVLSGRVSRTRTPDYDSPEGQAHAEKYAVMHPTSEERETAVLPNSRIGNLSAAQYINGKINRAVYIGEGNTGTRGRGNE